jgi:HEAT repeat protein
MTETEHVRIRRRRRRRSQPIVFAAALAVLLPGVGSAQLPSFEQVLAGLKSPKADERLSALKQLQSAGYPEAEAPVARLMTDPVPAVRRAAIATEMSCFLGESLTGRARPAFAIEVRNPIGAEAAFKKGLLAVMPQPVPSDVVDGLLAATADRDPHVAREALYGLGVIAPLLAGPTRRQALDRVGRQILPVLRNPDPAMREAALDVMARAFVRYDDRAPAVGEALGNAAIAEMNDGAATVRAAAARALGAMREARAAKALADRFQYFKAHGEDEALPTLTALAQVGNVSSEALLNQLLIDPDPAIRAAAIDGIARFDTLSHVTEIVRALQNERDARVTLALNFAVARAGGRVPLDTFLVVLANPTLAPRAEGYMLELTAVGRTTLTEWTSALRTQDLDTRLRLARILALSGDPTLAPALKPLLNDADERIAHTATRGLARLQLVPVRTTTTP